MIKFTHISKKYDNGNYGLKDVSFKIEQGEFVYVVGKSGAGKSTLLKMFNREEMPTSGEILMGNVRISRLKNNQVYKLRRQVGVIRQKDLFLPNRSAYENVEYVLSACETIGFWLHLRSLACGIFASIVHMSCQSDNRRKLRLQGQS